MATTKKDDEVKIEPATVPDEQLKKAPAEPTMEVPVAKLEGILNRLDSLEAESKKDKDTIAALEQTVSSTRLEEARARTGADKRSRVHFKKIDGKVVVGWPEGPGPDLINELVYNPSTNMPMGEILKANYYFVDGSRSGLIDQIKFTRATQLAHARVVEDKGDSVVLEFENPSDYDKKIEVHKKFLNA